MGDGSGVVVAGPEGRRCSIEDSMALRGLKLAWVCVAGLFISCSVILSFEFEGGTFLLFPRHFSFCFCVPAN